MYSSIDRSRLKKPGDYILSDVVIISYKSERGNSNPISISVKSLVTELNIYESIHNKTLSGNVVLIDAQNVVGTLPLIGFERIEFKLFTPSISRGFDFTRITGHPMYIYRISDRKGVNPRAQIYTLHFCSREMIRNEKVKAIKAYKGTTSNTVASILRDPDLLDSEKNLTLEESYGIHKYVAPIERPFDFIDEISKEAISKKFYSPGMIFFETSYGFNYKSYESLLAFSSDTARPAVAKFEPKPSSIRIEGNRDILQEMRNVSKFTIKDQFNTLKNLRNGVYSSLTTKYDSFFKTTEDIIFDYHKEYELSHHTEHDKDGGKTDRKNIAPFFNEQGKFISEFSLGTQYLRSDTSRLHNDVTDIDTPPTSNYLPRRLSNRLAFESFKLEMVVPGFTGLSAGDIITFEMPTHAPEDNSNMMDRDPYMSGRYLVSSISHQVSMLNDRHTMILECIKDSVRKPYPEELIDTFTGKEASERGIVDQYKLDEAVINQTDGIFKS